jgi:hypothetical protein
MTNNGHDDPTSRRRLSAADMHAVRAEIVRRHARGEKIRPIAAAVNMPRTSVLILSVNSGIV